MTRFPKFRISGSALERGRQHGSLARLQIENNLKVYMRNFKHYANLNWEQVQKRARTFIPVIEAFDPEIMEEIRGVGTGCGHPVEDIVALNSRTELMYGVSTNECTAIGAGGDATPDGTVIGQNWDWMGSLCDSCIVLEIVQPPKPTILMMTEAGIIGKIGLNDAGVGVCLNLLVSDTDGSQVGVPIHVMLRGILNSRTVGEAIRVVTKQKRAGSSNYLIADRNGQVVNLEVSPKNFDVIFGTDGTNAHTNHFISQVMAPHDAGKVILPDTFLRLGLAKQEIQKDNGNVGIETLKRILRDHTNSPYSICRHVDPRVPEEEQIETVCSVVMELESNTMHLAQGQPCKEEYIPIVLGSTVA